MTPISALLAPGAEREGNRLDMVVYAFLVGVWVYLAWLPLTTYSQMFVGWGSILALLALRKIKRRTIWLRILFLTLAIFPTMRYLMWRSLDTLIFPDYMSMVIGMILFLAELYGFVIYVLGLFVNIWPVHREPTPLPEDLAVLPSVDIMVPSYNEDAELLEITLRAALQVRYPHDKLKVYLLDDGGTVQKRNDPVRKRAKAAQERNALLKDLCARLGAHYLTRNRNEHAKAGNINAALRHTNGELILILDADHVPTVDFLERTVGEFCADPKLFLVQTPHFFINADPFERNLKIFNSIPSENEILFKVIQHGLDAWNSSFFCGSAAVLRRAALEEIGGLSELTITEDAETALILHSRGWHSVYIDHPMTSGLQPESNSSFILQRSRWAQGMLQVLLLKNPLRLKGLKWWQRLSYFNGCYFWLFPFARLVYIFAPSAYLIFGLQIYHANVMQVLAYALPHIIGTMLVSDLMFGRVRWAFVSELYELKQSVFMLPTLLGTLLSPSAPSFKVTPKGEQLDKSFMSPLSTPFCVIYLLTFISFAFVIWRWHVDPLHHGILIIAAGWQLLNFLLLTGAIGTLFEERQIRHHPRTPARNPVQLLIGASEWEAQILDLSSSGVKVRFSGDVGSMDHPRLRLHTPLRKESLEMPAELVWQKGQTAAFRFLPRSDVDKNALVLLARGDSSRWADIRLARERQPHRGFRTGFFLLRLGFISVRNHWAQILIRGLVGVVQYTVSLFLFVLRKTVLAAGRWAMDMPEGSNTRSKAV